MERVLNRLKDSGEWNRKAKPSRPFREIRSPHCESPYAALDTAIRWNTILDRLDSQQRQIITVANFVNAVRTTEAPFGIIWGRPLFHRMALT